MVLWMQNARAQDSDLNITCQKKKLNDTAPAQEANYESKETEQWEYTVTVENQSFKALSNLDVKYIIYVTRKQLGAKGPPRKGTTSGSSTIMSLESLAKTSFDTDPVKLTKATVTGGAYFADGASLTADDSITGIWVRVYQNGNLITEYTSPEGLNTTEKWQQ